MLISIKSGIIMMINSCRDHTNFAKQTVTEGTVLCTKNSKSLSSFGHLLALPFT